MWHNVSPLGHMNIQRRSGINKLYLSGFTLVELMVTVSILGILIMLAAPSFQSLIEQVRIESQINRLKTDMSYARSEAMRTGQTVHICKRNGGSTTVCGTDPANNWEQGWTIFPDADNDNTIDPNAAPLRISDPIATGRAFAAPNAPARDGFGFTAQGLPTGLGIACISFCPGGCHTVSPNSKFLVMNRLGRLRIVKYAEIERDGLSCPKV